jgi:putative ABC transport system permease protein
VLSGWCLSFMIVKILTGVFDPPPPHLFVPWAYLAALGGVTCGTIVAAGASVIHAMRRPAADIIRDL